MRKFLRRIHWVLTQQVGLDLVRMFRFAFAIPWYLSDWIKFRRRYTGAMSALPCLHDRHEHSGAVATEYFAQDLFVAQKIFKASPINHVDIGSRIDGFIAHVATFRLITVLDIRPNPATVANVQFVQADLMSPPASLIGKFNSMSCLHTLEHFGLGRYGDPIDPMGYVAGIRNMALLLADGGTFHLSVPVGRERVEFNAHRIFDPNSIIYAAAENGLGLEAISFFTAKGVRSDWDGTPAHLAQVAATDYALAVFTFGKRAAAAS